MEVSRRSFLSLPLGLSAAPAAPARPNVLVILADDLGSADLGCYGGEIETPNLDRLASQGVRFERFHSFPVCSPTRSGLMTGRSPMRLGIIYTVIRPWASYGLPLEEHIMPQSFKAAGYRTSITGKWHLGHSRAAFLPHNRGFDHAYGHVNGAIDYYTHMRDGGLDWHRNGKSVREEGYSTDLVAAETVRLIKGRDRSKPFFHYLPFNAPHAPLQAPQELIAKYSRIQDPTRRRFAAMVDAMDTAVGRVLTTLDQEGIADNTLVLFFSDNGGPIAQGARNTPLRGAKGSVWEGGLRVPAMMRWPGRLKAGSKSAQVATVLDVFPTLAAAAGVQPRNKLPFDGRDLWPSIAGGKTEKREDLFFAIESPRGIEHAVRSGEWKLVQHAPRGAGAPANYLFRIEEDPNETNDLAAKHPAVVKDLAARIEKWRGLHPPGGVRAEEQPPAGYKAPAQWAEAARGEG